MVFQSVKIHALVRYRSDENVPFWSSKYLNYFLTFYPMLIIEMLRKPWRFEICICEYFAA